MSVVGDAKIYNQIATAGRVRQVGTLELVDDLDISALQTRASGVCFRSNPLCRDVVYATRLSGLRVLFSKELCTAL